MPRAVALFFLATPMLVSQGTDAAYFKGDAKAIMVACADRARAIKPKDSRLLAEYGRAYLAGGDRAKAEGAFAAAIASDPKDAQTHFLIGYAWQMNGFKAEALAAFDKMVAMDPKGKNAFHRAAIVLLDGGNESKAVELMEKAWLLDKEDWQNCVEFGRACLRNGKKDLAALWFERTVAAKPKEERMWNEIALAYADGGVPARTSF